MMDPTTKYALKNLTVLLPVLLILVQVAAEYCNLEPDEDCYLSGFPICCSSMNLTCPLEQPTCELGNSTSFATHYCNEDLVGPDFDCYLNGHPLCCFNETLICPPSKPSCEIHTPMDKTYYCYDHPDERCYVDGWPTCCGYNNANWTCPTAKPDCELGSEFGFGGSYCARYQPNDACYINDGLPICCSDPTLKCPTYRPKCEVEMMMVPIDVEISKTPPFDSDDYCSGAGSAACYYYGWPACCFNETAVCPEERPNCELGTIHHFGGHYCFQHQPDYSCYLNGYPICCSDSEVKCPTYKPSCEIA